MTYYYRINGAENCRALDPLYIYIFYFKVADAESSRKYNITASDLHKVRNDVLKFSLRNGENFNLSPPYA